MHLFFAAAWIGAAVQLARLTANRENIETVWPIVSASLRFASSYLLVAATALVVTGLYKLSLILETDSGIFRSAYGQALALKIILALIMFGIAMWNHLVIFRRMLSAAASSEWQLLFALTGRSCLVFKMILAGSILLLLLVAGLEQL
jgi:putative copper export protein